MEDKLLLPLEGWSNEVIMGRIFVALHVLRSLVYSLHLSEMLFMLEATNQQFKFLDRPVEIQLLTLFSSGT